MKASLAGTLWASAGMTALLLGQKKTALGLLSRGIQKLEEHWREQHPDFKGGLGARWQESVKFYDATHQNTVNRYLHVAGIPMIAGGAVGLFVFRPFRPAWALAAGSFTLGWTLNILGHAAFEKNAPAFKDDPLSFVAGPLWDAAQLLRRVRRTEPHAPEQTVDARKPAHASANADEQRREVSPLN
jgi:hypothetical protein